MDASASELFSNADGAEPATAGSYGEAPGGFRLPSGTRLGPVVLQVGDLGRSLAFYEQVLGMRVVSHKDTHLSLGARGDERILIELRESPGARLAGKRRQLGLFHYAILLPDRPSLGRLVRHLADIGASPGAADHLVSEALYLQDPDGLGIEVYADRPRETWRRVGRELMISTDPLDMDDLVRAAAGERWSGMPAGTVIGHVHLHVGDLDKGAAYYSDALGFDRITWRYPGALFLGAGGYHHHLGTNTWAGTGARPPESGDARLVEWTIELPVGENVDAAERSLAAAGHRAERDQGGDLLTGDPWGTALRVRIASRRGGAGHEDTANR